MVMGLFGCGTTKYKLICDSDFNTEKTSYAEGETVRVTYDLIATDTDYSFYTDSEDVKLKQEYDDRHGYIFTFTMPAHDVTLSVKSRNSMEMDPEAHQPDESEAPSADANVETETWYCPECGTKNTTLYCAECGWKKTE